MTGFMIAGTSSSVGKTTVTLAIAAAFRRRGRTVQLFKGGPDFLDTGHHSRISGRKSRNLDTWMLSRETNFDILRRASHGTDAVIVEGMMGLFDGKSGAEERGSSAEIAKLFHLPVVLVVDAGKSARSVAALVLGFEIFDPELRIAGVILNCVANERHFQTLEAAIVARCSAPVLGWLPREPAISIPERHLGLQTAEESSSEDLELQMSTLGGSAEKYLAINRLLSLQFEIDLGTDSIRRTRRGAVARLGVAYDPAFTFYYEDNLELLRDQGAEIVFFSPLRDRALPAMLDALYLGGGYPELYAETLSSNTTMLSAIREFAESQRPIYAECGGMMYLAASLTMKDGKVYDMAGVLPCHVQMMGRLRHLGYASVEFTQDCLLGPEGTIVPGHSFHYSRMTTIEGLSSSFRIEYSLSGQQEQEGFGVPGANVLASYIHLHFLANPTVAEHFIKASIAARTPCLAK
jgi:cobyrinic acid a,c-diamide synthase